jgi:anionic cell wall polymer biosynthesis LytR-Cps2A-Psr (LCP) family protein
VGRQGAPEHPLVGVDQRQGDAFFNTDTLIVASIDPVTKEVAMFQVPRDTVDVPVPPNARNVWGSTYSGKINSWYAFNRNRADLWRGDNTRERGFNALKALLGELYGLDIRYYVMVNFRASRTPSTPSAACRSTCRSVAERLPGRRRRHPDLHPGRAQHMNGGDA